MDICNARITNIRLQCINELCECYIYVNSPGATTQIIKDNRLDFESARDLESYRRSLEELQVEQLLDLVCAKFIIKK